jgi:hypothetical protein
VYSFERIPDGSEVFAVVTPSAAYEASDSGSPVGFTTPEIHEDRKIVEC